MAPAAGEEEEPWARQPAGRQPGEAQPRLPPAARQQPQPRAPGASLLCRSRFPNRTGRPGPDTVPGARGWRAMRELPGPAGSKGQTARKPEAGPFTAASPWAWETARRAGGLHGQRGLGLRQPHPSPGSPDPGSPARQGRSAVCQCVPRTPQSPSSSHRTLSPPRTGAEVRPAN